MRTQSLQSGSSPLRRTVFALCAALCLLVFFSTAAFANTVEIYDNAGVLNRSQVQDEASKLSDPIRIYTVRSYPGTVSQFNNEAVRDVNTSKTIVIAINTGARYVYITGGKDAGLNSSDYNNAVSAFGNNFRSSNSYTSATIAAIDSLKSKLGSGFFGLSPLVGGLCCVGLLVLVAFGVFGALRRRGRGTVAPAYQAPTAYGPQNFGPQNYGAPQQGGGMNPLMAGGLGAAGGGLIGYELGKLEGEREARREMQGGFGGGGFGGDQGGFGGGAGGFFGGGGGGFGGDQGGGNFGGGAGGGFGGDQGGFGGGGNEGFGGFGGGGGGDSFGGGSDNNSGGGGNF